MTAQTQGERLWRPSAPERTRLHAFRRYLQARDEPVGTDYRALHAYSIDAPGRFWRHLWDFAGLEGSLGERDLVDGERMAAARFFPDGRLNFAANLLRFTGPEAALIGRDEGGHREVLSRDDLRGAVFTAMAQLEALGLGPGERVAAAVPNRIDAVVLMLAVTGLGAVWSSCSPDFGSRAALDRFEQVDPVLLIGCDGYRYGGRSFDTRARLGEIADGLPRLRATLVIPVLEARPVLDGIRDARLFRRGASAAEHPFAPRAFNDPLYIMFSSGTTGAPKCIVHGIGGSLLQHVKEQQLHCDAGEGDALLFFTTCGWMMWNWLISGLASGITVCLYDGAPTHPDPGVLLRAVDAEGLTHLGISPGWLSLLEKDGYRPRDHHALARLRCVLSTGSPLPPQAYRFVYDAVGADLHLASITGGTDIMGCFALGCPELPVRAGEIQVAGLGMALDFVDSDGRPVRDARGELVCTRPFPSMPIAFVNDPDGARLREAYFTPWPDIWRHGDFGEWVSHDDGTPDGVVIHGRSDAVLNRGGVRIGTAEIYRQTESIGEIAESLAVTRDAPTGQEIVLFVRLQPGAVLDDDLRARIRATIRSGASPRHVPDRIAAVADIPRTRSGKIVELAVREVIHGGEVRNIGALANPEALEHFRDHPDLRDAT
ncbi:MAG TPA: acetoacetate--CoA ligase [Pseudomonadales bacterium]|nr:acetoacetate--CoA ligase [Pseudomonadales bacterium]